MSAVGSSQPTAPLPEQGSAGPNGDQEKWRIRIRKLLRALASLGPFALVFGTYSLVLDHLPEGWFSRGWLPYLFAVLAALCVGLALRAILQVEPIHHLLGRPDSSMGALLPLPRASSENDRGTFHEILDGTERQLLRFYRCRPRGGVVVCGWSQFYGDDVPPSAIGSSYGLRIAMALDVRDLTIDRHRVIESILSLQRSGGGWSASTQRDVGRPEVTAWVLGALIPAGLEAATREELVSTLEQMLDERRDPVGMRNTCVVTAAVSTLALFAPKSPRLPELVERLVQGTVGGAQAKPRWGAVLQDRLGHTSAPHTARAIVALHRAAAVLSNGRDLKQQAREAAEWLCEDLDLSGTEEQIRRPHQDEIDGLYVYHFTPAWVARALMLEGHDPMRSDPLRAAVQAVVRSQERGTWRWHDMEPIWMAYQGVSVLRDFGLRAKPSVY